METKQMSVVSCQKNRCDAARLFSHVSYGGEERNGKKMVEKQSSNLTMMEKVDTIKYGQY